MTRINARFSLSGWLIVSGVCCGCVGNPVCDAPACSEDTATTQDVRELLLAQPGITAYSLDVLTRDHVVYLYGIVDTERERRTAESVARGAKGAGRVVDLIGVNGR